MSTKNTCAVVVFVLNGVCQNTLAVGCLSQSMCVRIQVLWGVCLNLIWSPPLAAQGSLSHPHAFVVCAQYLYTRKLAKKAFRVKTITNANFSTLVAEYFVSLAFYKLYCSQLFPRYNNNMCDTKSHDS